MIVSGDDWEADTSLRKAAVTIAVEVIRLSTQTEQWSFHGPGRRDAQLPQSAGAWQLFRRRPAAWPEQGRSFQAGQRARSLSWRDPDPPHHAAAARDRCRAGLFRKRSRVAG